MVSKRNFIIILLMMGVLFVLFQFFLVMKDEGNNYAVNDSYSESIWRSTDVYSPKIVSSGEDTPEGEYVVYIGSSDTDVYATVVAWCTYRKMNLVLSDSPQNYQKDSIHLPLVILIDGEQLDLNRDLPTLTKWEEEEVPLIYCTLPAEEQVAESEPFMNLLGVNYIMEPEEKLVGIHVLGGFLLGGESFYQVNTDEDEKHMDLDLDIPMYHVFNGTKSYIIGMYEKTPERTEEQPSLLWRYTTKTTQIFAVNGDFIRDMSGIGYLEAIIAEIRNYDIYPVVNVQELSLVNFPGLSDENPEELARIYSRSQSGVYRDLVWPGLIAVMEKNGMVPTCYLTPQMDYRRENTPSESELTYYLKQLKEQNGEAALSMVLLADISLSEKVKADRAFFSELDDAYTYSAVYVGTQEPEQVGRQLSADYLSSIRTIVTDKSDLPFGYCEADVTRQAVTANACPYYFSEDLKLKGYETALGYSNVLLDLTDLVWPENTEDEWQNVSKIISANLTTYWKPFSAFDPVTASEANRRIRNFLALSYEKERSGDAIHVTIHNFTEEAWFILRLHDERVAEVQGGSFEKIEDGAYLIRAAEAEITITVTGESEGLFVE